VLTWLAGYKLRWFARPKTVIHPSTNQARHRVTSLIETQHATTRPDHHIWRTDMSQIWRVTCRDGLLAPFWNSNYHCCPNASPCSSVVFTGCKSQSKYGSAFVCWPTAVSTVQIRPISLTASVWQLMLRATAIFAHQRQQLELFHPSDDQPWVTGHSLSPLRGCRTVCCQLHKPHYHSTNKNWRHFFSDRALSTTEPIPLIVLTRVIPCRLYKVPL